MAGGGALGVGGAEAGAFEQANEIGSCSVLQRKHRSTSPQGTPRRAEYLSGPPLAHLLARSRRAMPAIVPAIVNYP